MRRTFCSIHDVDDDDRPARQLSPLMPEPEALEHYMALRARGHDVALTTLRLEPHELAERLQAARSHAKAERHAALRVAQWERDEFAVVYDEPMREPSSIHAEVKSRSIAKPRHFSKPKAPYVPIIVRRVSRAHVNKHR